MFIGSYNIENIHYQPGGYSQPNCLEQGAKYATNLEFFEKLRDIFNLLQPCMTIYNKGVSAS